MAIFQGAKKGKRTKQDVERLCELAHMCDEKDGTDVLGSYTGTARDGDEPVQDADDL